MKVKIAKLTSQGRITIPVERRKECKIKVGTRIYFQDGGKG